MRTCSIHVTVAGAAVVAATIFVTGCSTNDTGKACDDGAPTSIGIEPVGGENPVIEVVRIKRDGACESFKCLRHLGIAPYCTRECEFFESEEDTACTSDSDCDELKSCAEDGVCREDDCVAGFACRTVQKTGPLAGLNLCVRRTGCHENTDCKAIGDVNCVEHACFDSCLKLADPADCLFHARECQPVVEFQAQVDCQCLNNEVGLGCLDPELICQNPEGFEPWPTGSVSRTGICVQARPPR